MEWVGNAPTLMVVSCWLLYFISLSIPITWCRTSQPSTTPFRNETKFYTIWFSSALVAWNTHIIVAALKPFVPMLSWLHVRVVTLHRHQIASSVIIHPSPALTRRLWLLNATSRSFFQLWLHPEGLRPTAPHLFYSAWWIFTRTSLWMGGESNTSGVSHGLSRL